MLWLLKYIVKRFKKIEYDNKIEHDNKIEYDIENKI